MAVAGWDGEYGASIPVSGSVELIDVGGTVLADYGLDVMAGSLACLEGDRVAFLSAGIRWRWRERAEHDRDRLL